MAEHLAHFGIRILEMEKTDKMMMQLELDVNQRYEWMAVQEEGSQLELLYGPGCTGIINLESSCYMSAVSSIERFNV